MAKQSSDQPASETPAPAATAVYEVAVNGPIKIGGVIAWRGARLYLTEAQASSINSIYPNAVTLIGVRL